MYKNAAKAWQRIQGALGLRSSEGWSKIAKEAARQELKRLRKEKEAQERLRPIVLKVKIKDSVKKKKKNGPSGQLEACEKCNLLVDTAFLSRHHSTYCKAKTTRKRSKN